jgi:N6-adenosine-specific RNA methylase IME4
VCDPPWENKSAERSQQYCSYSYYILSIHIFGSYQTLPNFELFKLKIQNLGNPKGFLIVMWVTNKKKYQHFIKNQLFPYWGVTFLQTWYWLKVTVKGEFIYPLNSPHKFPYEPFMLGWGSHNNQNNHHELPINVSSLRDREPQLIVSVPGPHSCKPCVDRILIPQIWGQNTEKVTCLELFARNLRKHFFSWGNQVLKYQEIVKRDQESLEKKPNCTNNQGVFVQVPQ